jgi:hypothetical protein
MGIFKSIGNFLFGKNPDIFDENGQVSHKHPKKKWDAWQNKFKTDPSYNWRNHTGTLAGRPQPGEQKK